jgi:hypothetical protein
MTVAGHSQALQERDYQSEPSKKGPGPKLPQMRDVPKSCTPPSVCVLRQVFVPGAAWVEELPAAAF